MFLIWRGWGIAVVGIAFVALVVGILLTQILGAAGGGILMLLGLAIAVGGVGTWFIGKRLNGAPIDPTTLGFHSRHSLFFVPFQWWGPVLVVLGALLVIGGLA